MSTAGTTGRIAETLPRLKARIEQSRTSAVVLHSVSDLPTDRGLGERSLLR